MTTETPTKLKQGRPLELPAGPIRTVASVTGIRDLATKLNCSPSTIRRWAKWPDLIPKDRQAILDQLASEVVA